MGRGYYEEQFCEIILNIGEWFRRRWCLKDIFSVALAVLLFSGAKPFVQGHHGENSCKVI